MHRSGQQSLFCRHQTVGDGVPGQLRLDLSGERAGTGGEGEGPHPAGTGAATIDGPRPEIPLAEAEANAFSAALLMPRDLFMAEYRRCRGDVAALQARFNCSEKATRRRIETLFSA